MRDIGKKKPLYSFAAERPRTRKKNLDNLTMDAIAAEEAGVSYGQYKAVNPHTKDTREAAAAKPKKERPENESICPVCGATFKTKKCKRYCTEQCKEKHDGIARRERLRARMEGQCNGST